MSSPLTLPALARDKLPFDGFIGVQVFSNALRQSGLYVPVRVREQRGVLMMVNDPGSAGFDRGHMTLARRFFVLASHALATRVAGQSAAESARAAQIGERRASGERRKG